MVTVEDFSRLVSGVYAAAVAQPITAVLRQLYGFTNTESEIALRLAHGADLRRISDELSISLITVRTHLQHAFDKTHTPPSRTCPTTARRKPVTIRCTPERAGLLTNPQCDCSRPTHAEHHRHIRNILDAYPPSGCTLEESQAVPEAISTIVRERQR